MFKFKDFFKTWIYPANEFEEEGTHWLLAIFLAIISIPIILVAKIIINMIESSSKALDSIYNGINK